MSSQALRPSPTSVNPALAFLRLGVTGLQGGYQATGELLDPVFSDQTEYGTAYYAVCNAVLALVSGGSERVEYQRRARAGLEATLRAIGNPDDIDGAVADYTHGVFSPGFRNLRDFMWAPALRTYRLLRRLGEPALDSVAAQIAAVKVPDVFSERPPVNWATVWILGEFLRIQQGLSPYTVADIDAWLEPFFAENPDLDHGFYKELREATGAELSWESAIDLERGFYREPGVPNSYDLFSRTHLLELVAEGYDGVWAPQLRALVSPGTRRSLAVQLSTGSLATAYRSSAHLWNLGIQYWYFENAASILADSDPELAGQAASAAIRALRAAQACVRPTGDISPVENVHPASWRVGHESYTMDAHYVTLALGYFADAVEHGFTGAGEPVELPGIRVHIDPDPVNRHLAHGCGWSIHVTLAPAAGYDSLGIADLTTGLGRRLRFGGQTHWGRPGTLPDAHRLSDQVPLTLGLAIRHPDRSIHPISAMVPTGERGATATENGLRAFADVAEGRYEIEVGIDDDEVRVVEQLGQGPRSLQIPYLRDRGDGYVTEVGVDGQQVRLVSGDEQLVLTVADDVEKVLHIPFGYESRHGLVGFVRLDLAGTGAVSYSIRRVS
ncbi:MAG: hypothetical protein KIT69_03925 [Propionibacteriaceae bacterium]|nr:hypothetical protein [Propionibacteriaceae bacterium]